MKPHHFPAADLALLGALLITHVGAVLLGVAIGWHARNALLRPVLYCP